MNTVTPLHPPLTEAIRLPHPNDPDGGLINTAAFIQMAKNAGTARGDALYRAFTAAWRALEGQPLDDRAREEAAFLTAAEKVGLTFRHEG